MTVHSNQVSCYPRNFLYGIYWYSPFRSQITAIGDDVNFCSRLEGFADNDQIIISKELNDELRKITNTAFITKKIKIPEDKKMKIYEQVKYVYELIGRLLVKIQLTVTI